MQKIIPFSLLLLVGFVSCKKEHETHCELKDKFRSMKGKWVLKYYTNEFGSSSSGWSANENHIWHTSQELFNDTLVSIYTEHHETSTDTTDSISITKYYFKLEIEFLDFHWRNQVDENIIFIKRDLNGNILSDINHTSMLDWHQVPQNLIPIEIGDYKYSFLKSVSNEILELEKTTTTGDCCSTSSSIEKLTFVKAD